MFTIDTSPMEYAMTQNNLGNGYGVLADTGNKFKNCRLAIESYQEAKNYRKWGKMGYSNSYDLNFYVAQFSRTARCTVSDLYLIST